MKMLEQNELKADDAGQLPADPGQLDERQVRGNERRMRYPSLFGRLLEPVVRFWRGEHRDGFDRRQRVATMPWGK